VKIDHEARTITLRQSWLDSATICPERGRLGIVKPEWDQLDSDEALIGTAMHAGVEAFLRGHCDDPAEFAHNYASTMIDPATVRWTKRTSISEIADLAHGCATEWRQHIYPMVPDGGRTEVTFQTPMFHRGDWTVLLSGTVDYVLGGEMWDWKSSGSRDWKPWEKQRWAVQPTAYAYAAMNGAVQGFTATSWPLTFRYGVVYKPRSKNGGYDHDIITVTRTQGDVDWMMAKARTYVDLALTALDITWPQIDSENHLCSTNWCPWWSTCKGAHVSEDNYVTPSQTVPRPRKIMVAAGGFETGIPAQEESKED
jgi:hypothetical protein